MRDRNRRVVSRTDIKIMRIIMMNGIIILIAVLLVVECLSMPVTKPSCINKEGQAVDWWVAYPFPKSFRDLNWRVGYQYADSSSTASEFTIMGGEVDQ